MKKVNELIKKMFDEVKIHINQNERREFLFSILQKTPDVIDDDFFEKIVFENMTHTILFLSFVIDELQLKTNIEKLLVTYDADVIIINNKMYSLFRFESGYTGIEIDKQIYLFIQDIDTFEIFLQPVKI